MDTIHISNRDEQITPNFNVMEFFRPSLTKPELEFDLYKCLVDALQAFREYFNVGWIVSSVYRPTDPLTMPPAHRVPPPAVDCYSAQDWADIMPKIREEMKNWRNSELMQKVLATGCNCCIIEGGCLHIHYRTDHNSHPDDTKWAEGLYLGEWQPDGGEGINTVYSL